LGRILTGGHWPPVLLVSIAVMQYWTFVLSRFFTPTIIYTTPIPGQLYDIRNMLIKPIWFFFFGFAGVDSTNAALERMASN